MNTPSSALSDEMKGAMSTLLNAVIFEQWLRFSWIEEDEEGDFCIQIPAETVSELVEDYPEYEGLIAQLNGTIVDADMACSAVLGYARSSLGEQSLAVLEHNEFQNMVGRFHQWLNDNVEALDQDPKNFDQWRKALPGFGTDGFRSREWSTFETVQLSKVPETIERAVCAVLEKGGNIVPAFLFWVAGKSQAALAWSGPGLENMAGALFQHDEVWGKERIRLTERCYLPQSERSGPASASASRGMSTTCDPAAHGAT